MYNLCTICYIVNLTLHLSILYALMSFQNISIYWSKLWHSKTGFYEVKNLFLTSKDMGAGTILLHVFDTTVCSATSLILSWFFPFLQTIPVSSISPQKLDLPLVTYPHWPFLGNAMQFYLLCLKPGFCLQTMLASIPCSISQSDYKNFARSV